MRGALVLLAACARTPRGLVWQAEPGCGASAEEGVACEREGGELARAPRCGGPPPPPEEPREARATERAYRTGEARCVCLTRAVLEACRNVP